MPNKFSNYDIWHLKVQFTLNEGDMLDHLTTSMPALADKYEQGKDITATEHYKENLMAYHALVERDRSTRYIMFTYMHDNLVGEFECFPNARTCGPSLRSSLAKHPL